MDRTVGRREKVARRLKAESADALLVSSPTNVRYLSGFTGEDATLIVMKDRSIIVSDGRFTTQLEEECPGLEAHIRPIGQMMPEAIALVAKGLAIHRLAFESAELSVAVYEDLRGRLPAIEMVGVSHWVEVLRAVKDREEVVAIREAIVSAERAFGKRSALPHARPTATTRIGDADFVLIDWGATGSPYKSDLTRVLVTGKVSPKFEKIYRTVLAAQERGIAAIRPGARAGDVDAEARSVIEEAGFGRFFGHGLGHGLGMDIHEAPRLRKGADDRLLPGMVVTVEPGIYIPDWGGIRVEDDVLVTPDGCEVLTRVPKSLDTVRVA
jgi:Xaa-Pro aminopeptidase